MRENIINKPSRNSKFLNILNTYFLPIVVFLSSLLALEICSQTYWNQWEPILRNNSLLNVLLVNVSFMGDAWFAAGILTYAFFKKWPDRYRVLIASVTTILMIQIVKNLMVGGEWKFYVESCQHIFLNLGFSDDGGQFLPSGFIALYVALGIAMTIRNPQQLKLFMFTWPIMAFARFYLAEQAVAEILFGVLVGIGCVYLSLILLHWRDRMPGREKRLMPGRRGLTEIISRHAPYHKALKWRIIILCGAC